MIDEYWTWVFYGYHSDDLSYGSRKPIVVMCDDCYKYRVSTNNAYKDLCQTCAFKKRPPITDATKLKISITLIEKYRDKDNFNLGKHHTEETKRILSDAATGEKNPMYDVHLCGERNHNFGKIFPAEYRKKISDNHADVSGSNNPAWKGGVSPWRSVLQSSKAYKNWRKSVFERDDYTCQTCGDDKGGNLQAHHVLPVRDNKNTLLIFDIDNGITLCNKCHDIVNGREYEFVEQFEDIIRGKQP